MYSPLQALSSYWLAILISSVVAASLAILGMHLAARDRSVQTLCVTQGSMFGVLIALGIGGYFHENFFTTSIMPLIGAFVFANVTYKISEKFIAGKLASKNTVLVAIFAILISFCQLASALFPSLESHMTQKFFGDLATIANKELILILIVSVAVAVLLIKNWKDFSCESFDLALFGRAGIFGGRQIDPRIFQISSFVLICISVQAMGFLFTTGALLIPTTIQGVIRSRGLWRHHVSVAILASSATFIGFSLSIMSGKLPTVPTIIFIMTILGYPVLRLLSRSPLVAEV
ncbi:MAG: metal ABC transporter permease [Proteobacteria bacterium]|nr:metal ABC transporter permease [Pseudomonadota bacterium]